MNAPRKPIVWVVKEQAKSGPAGTQIMDYTPAMQFGEVKFITNFDPPLLAGPARTAWQEQIEKFGREFDVNTDYIVLTGSPVAIFALGAVMTDIADSVKLLVWRREQGRYIVSNPLQ